jgi:hypothetical protein
MADTNLYATLTYVDAKRLYCAATDCTNVVLNADMGNQVFGAFDASCEPHKKVHIDATVYLCDEHMEEVRQGNSPRWSTPAPVNNPSEEAIAQRKPGKTKLVYDKTKHTIVTVNPFEHRPNTSSYIVRDADGNITARSENMAKWDKIEE